MSNRQRIARIRPLDLSTASAALWLSVTAFLALLALYVVGLEHGAVSLVRGDASVHEFLHDARHLLGFPCH
ncbi:cobalt transporter [Mycobacterium saskatchewanense]|uniref:Cobalt transporter n=1 Tax=Mycobacterium saskatchewanense TaxID=220927 RepID=A0AAJ3NSG5_9MYCO|nr:CbtB-domain containing protein [Mycobacterium saskatchewanense]ORW72335.1 cobalt transporter [Mycobacterium saskatchewanense]BBX63784.1 cobalt transporter [Mycobacterium saskatchewanense]